MKRIGFLTVALLLALLTAACGTDKTGGAAQTDSQEDGAYQTITAEEAKTMMDEQTVTVVDVRTAEEYAQAHIAGAVLVPNETIGDGQPEALPDKNVPLLVYCRSGRRSAEASAKLAKLGYVHVYDFGGIIDWPYDTVTGESQG